MENNKKTNLVEIKKGQTGTGLLIESDGYISRDVSEYNNKIITEANNVRENGEWSVPNPFVMDVILQKFGIQNANGRIYPEHVLKREVEKYQKLIQNKMALGECNHPTETSIDLGRVSHNLIECHWEGHTLVGKIEFNLTEGFRKYGICSSLGDTCANLILNGYRIGVSSRGMGSVVNKFGQTIVQDDYEIICWDVVASPSTPNAYIGTPEELQPFVEGTEKDGEALNETLSNKISKIENILKG